MDFIMSAIIMIIFLTVIILYGVRNNCIGGPTILNHKKNINPPPKPKPYPKDDVHVRDI